MLCQEHLPGCAHRETTGGQLLPQKDAQGSMGTGGRLYLTLAGKGRGGFMNENAVDPGLER